MGHRIAGIWHDEPGDFKLKGLWYPDGDEITKYMIARLETEPFYRAARLFDALTQVRAFRAAVDCGAWVGAWSRELGKRFKRVIAIDAHPGNARCVEKNCADRHNVTVLNCAVGELNGEATVMRSTYGGTIESWAELGTEGRRINQARDVALAWTEAPQVPMRRIDDIEEIRALSAIDYLKVHVNGAELLALRGAARTISKHRPAVTVVIKKALADCGHTEKDIVDFMTSAGYRIGSRLKPYWTFVPQ